jgi:octanoyl-[GcvH]:protein N-octanoyltransferase
MRTTLIRGLAEERDRGLFVSSDLGASRRLLDIVADNSDLGRIVRLYRPSPTVAFSRRETLLDGFAEAIAEATAFGFEPVVRPAGGRAVVLDTEWLVLDVITPEARHPRVEYRDVFVDFGARFVELFSDLGLRTAVAPVTGEYCPGDFSVSCRNEVKLVGTAQRVTRGARLFSASIPFAVSSTVEELLTRVNELLELEWNPSTLGSVSSESPAIRLSDLDAALLHTFARDIDSESSLADFFDTTYVGADSGLPARGL